MSDVKVMYPFYGFNTTRFRHFG